MWPWEHLAFGYLLYSLGTHLLRRRGPSAAEAYAVLAGTQLPDLIDKPLAWWFHVLPAGRTLAHSLFVAVPLVAAGFLLAAARGRVAAGVAFAVAYVSHLFADGIYPALLGGEVFFGFLFWPLVPAAEGEGPQGWTHVAELFGVLLEHLQSPAGGAYVALEVALVSAFVLLWLADGAPGLPQR